MAAGTFTLPDGTKVRAASQRRYIVVNPRYSGNGIIRRSDSFATAKTAWLSSSGSYIVDTVTGDTLYDPRGRI
jgi:hypothetical protein